jgi:hypothetical protein
MCSVIETLLIIVGMYAYLCGIGKELQLAASTEKPVSSACRKAGSKVEMVESPDSQTC